MEFIVRPNYKKVLVKGANASQTQIEKNTLCHLSFTVIVRITEINANRNITIEISF